jgi:hypothetical protein
MKVLLMSVISKAKNLINTAKIYTEAQLLITQAENYTHYEELESEYLSMKTQ